MLAGTAECSYSVGGWVSGMKPVPGSALYISADTTFLCKSVFCLLSLTSFDVYPSDNQIQCTWSETCISLPVITTSNQYILTATAFPDLYCIRSSCRMITWTSLSTLDSPHASYPALVHQYPYAAYTHSTKIKKKEIMKNNKHKIIWEQGIWSAPSKWGRIWSTGRVI